MQRREQLNKEHVPTNSRSHIENTWIIQHYQLAFDNKKTGTSLQVWLGKLENQSLPTVGYKEDYNNPSPITKYAIKSQICDNLKMGTWKQTSIQIRPKHFTKILPPYIFSNIITTTIITSLIYKYHNYFHIYTYFYHLCSHNSLQSRYYVHSPANALANGMNPLILQAYLLGEWLWH